MGKQGKSFNTPRPPSPSPIDRGRAVAGAAAGAVAQWCRLAQGRNRGWHRGCGTLFAPLR